MEAHSRDAAAVEGGLLDKRTGLRGRLAALLRSDEPRGVGGSAKSGRPSDPARRLEHYLGKTKVAVLHHRRLPGNGSKISHLIVGPAGITVVDSRKYAGRRVQLTGGAIRIGLRERSDLVHGLVARVKAIRELLEGTPYAGVRVEAALARRKVEGTPILANSDARILVCGTRRIAGEASRPGPLSRSRVNGLAAYLDSQLAR